MGKSILIAESLDVIRAGLRTILKEDGNISDIVEATDTESLKAQLASKQIDLIIVNQELVNDFSSLPSGHFAIMALDPDITGMRQAFEHEACAYISPNVSAALLRSLFDVTKGSFLVEPALTPLLLKCAKNDIQLFTKENLLTPREKEIFHLLREGYSRTSIAEQLTISEATLKTHIKNIRGKREADGNPLTSGKRSLKV